MSEIKDVPFVASAYQVTRILKSGGVLCWESQVSEKFDSWFVYTRLGNLGDVAPSYCVGKVSNKLVRNLLSMIRGLVKCHISTSLSSKKTTRGAVVPVLSIFHFTNTCALHNAQALEQKYRDDGAEDTEDDFDGEFGIAMSDQSEGEQLIRRVEARIEQKKLIAKTKTAKIPFERLSLQELFYLPNSMDRIIAMKVGKRTAIHPIVVTDDFSAIVRTIPQRQIEMCCRPEELHVYHKYKMENIKTEVSMVLRISK